jgi:hypothetical protein
MKSKILTSLGVAVIAVSLFLSANTINEKGGNLDLASLISMNTANAEEDCNLSPAERAAECDYFCTHAQFYTCDILFLCGNGYATIRCVDGDYQ